jgi:hypothetical protein
MQMRMRWGGAGCATGRWMARNEMKQGEESFHARGKGRLGANADFAAAFVEWENFAGVEGGIGIESVMDAAHESEIGVGKDERHKLAFFHADAVLAGESAADLDAIADDFVGGGDGSLEMRGIAGIVKNDGVEIAVAGMKDVADLESVGFSDFRNAAKGLRELGAWDDAVENVIAGSEPAKRAESVFATLPEELPLAGVACDANFAGAMSEADFVDGRGLRGNGFGEAFEFDEEDCGAIPGESGVDVVFNRAKSPAINHFAGRRGNGAGGDVGDGLRGVVNVVKDGEQGFHGLGLAGKFYGDFGDKGEGAFGADKQAAEIVTGSVAMAAADADDFSARENEFEGDDVIGGDAAGESVRATGVFGDVAADGAGFLAGGIGGEIEAGVFDGASDIEIDDAGLDDGAPIIEIEGEDFVHAPESEHDSTRAGQRAAGEAGARAATDDGKIVKGGEFDDFGDFAGGFRKNDEAGAAFLDRAVVFVEKEIFGAREDAGGGE